MTTLKALEQLDNFLPDLAPSPIRLLEKQEKEVQRVRNPKKIIMAGVRIYPWNHFIGSAIWNPSREIATFEFDQDFVKQGFDQAPITMPLEDFQRGERIFEFPALNKDVYHGLPGLLSELIKVGSSAGGQRAKAIITYNKVENKKIIKNDTTVYKQH